MRRLAAVLFVVLASCTSANRPLSGLVLVIDAGHGGEDPGAHGIFQGQEVYEAPYVADVARRLEILAKEKGAIIYLTRHDPSITGPINVPAQQIIDFHSNRDVYTINGERVRARPVGLAPRVALAQKALKDHPWSRIVFISIHFDNVGGASIVGTHVVIPSEKRPRIVDALAKEFGAARMLRTEDGKPLAPVVVSGDASHGMRRLYVLRGDTNPIGERVLIELGNFGSPADVWRLRNPANRQKYAELIAKALVRFMRGAS